MISLFKKQKQINTTDNLIKQIEGINHESGEIIKKRKNLLAHTTADTPYALLQAALRTYSEGPTQSTHIQIPPSEPFLKYYVDQLTFFKTDGLASDYRENGLKLQYFDTQLRRTDMLLEEGLKLFVDFDKAYNDFLKIHAFALKKIANPPKDTYQTGIQ